MSYLESPFHLQHYCGMVDVIVTVQQLYIIIHSLTMSANTCVPVRKSGYQIHCWSDEPDELKHEKTEAAKANKDRTTETTQQCHLC